MGWVALPPVQLQRFGLIIKMENYQNEQQDKRLCKLEDCLSGVKKDKVSWIVFYAFVLIIIGFFTYLINGQFQANASNEQAHGVFTQTKEDIAVMKESINWIKTAIETNGIKPIITNKQAIK